MPEAVPPLTFGVQPRLEVAAIRTVGLDGGPRGPTSSPSRTDE
jgi:hypothetical protein